MKHIHQISFFAFCLCINMGISCTKEALIPGPEPLVTTNPPQTQPSFIAKDWKQVSEGFFNCVTPVDMSTFRNYGETNTKVNIYLVDINGRTLINNRSPFLNGMIWASYTESDVTVFYRNYRYKSVQDLPFSSLFIEIEIF